MTAKKIPDTRLARHVSPWRPSPLLPPQFLLHQNISATDKSIGNERFIERKIDSFLILSVKQVVLLQSQAQKNKIWAVN